MAEGQSLDLLRSVDIQEYFCLMGINGFLDALHSVGGTQEQTHSSLQQKVKLLGTPGAVCYTQNAGISSPQGTVAARYDAQSKKIYIDPSLFTPNVFTHEAFHLLSDAHYFEEYSPEELRIGLLQGSRTGLAIEGMNEGFTIILSFLSDYRIDIRNGNDILPALRELFDEEPEFQRLSPGYQYMARKVMDTIFSGTQPQDRPHPFHGLADAYLRADAGSFFDLYTSLR